MEVIRLQTGEYDRHKNRMYVYMRKPDVSDVVGHTWSDLGTIVGTNVLLILGYVRGHGYQVTWVKLH